MNISYILPLAKRQARRRPLYFPLYFPLYLRAPGVFLGVSDDGVDAALCQGLLDVDAFSVQDPRSRP